MFWDYMRHVSLNQWVLRKTHFGVHPLKLKDNVCFPRLFHLLILTQLSDRVDRFLLPIINEGHNIRRPVGRYSVSRSWRSTACWTSFGGVPVLSGRRFFGGGRVVYSCAFLASLNTWVTLVQSKTDHLHTAKSLWWLQHCIHQRSHHC